MQYLRIQICKFNYTLGGKELPTQAPAKAGTLLTILFGVLLVPSTFQAQNFLDTDQGALNTPPGKTASIESLAQYLCAELPDDTHKIRAIYAWVTLHIAYIDSTEESDMWATPEHLERQSPERVLQNRSAVCQGYANLFCALATAAGLPCEVVTGLVKNSDNEISQIGHAWAVARIEGEWQLFDPTWGVPPLGLSRWKVVDKFFMADPADFVLKHLPDDPVWQLLENPLSEGQFRVSSDAEILASAREEREAEFKFRDTLDHWLTLDNVQKILASESRILRYNGSNERVILDFGQRYWGLFFELQNTLDSLTDTAILADTLEIDTVWFNAQMRLLDYYHGRSSILFARLETPERMEKTKKFYGPKDVAAILEKMRGDVRTGVFEYLNHTLLEGVLNEYQIAQLKYQADLAIQAYLLAEQNIDCAKMAGNCFDIQHNRSLMAIQLGRHRVRFAQELANDQTARKNLKIIALNLREARSLLLMALEDCERMRSRPTKFAFVDERIVTARQWLLNLRTCEIRTERTALSPELESVLSSQKISLRSAETLAEKMSWIARSIQGLKDTLKYFGRELGDDFAKTALFNLQIEHFTLQFNHANLLYRIGRNNYEIAVAQNELPKQADQIRYELKHALQTLKEASSALDFMEDSGYLTATSIDQKQLQVNKLSKALREILNKL